MRGGDRVVGVGRRTAASPPHKPLNPHSLDMKLIPFPTYGLAVVENLLSHMGFCYLKSLEDEKVKF
ncbi:MAG: hypothetical protein FWH20_01440 [Oscillospiraceae bacterium]|nr:hypothetical protein [Oscillospiraceae bacterium]